MSSHLDDSEVLGVLQILKSEGAKKDVLDAVRQVWPKKKRRLHIHVYKPGRMFGAVALTRQGATGRRNYVCRCGEQQFRNDWYRESDAEYEREQIVKHLSVTNMTTAELAASDDD